MHFTIENGDKTKKIEAGVGVEYIIQTEKTIRDFSESKHEYFCISSREKMFLTFQKKHWQKEII